MASSKLSWNVALAGECMVSRPFAMHDDPPAMAVIDLLRSADLTYGHLEMNVADYSELTYAARGDWLGSFMMADPQIARDLKWAGIDIMSLAHNHSVDFGEPGIAATIRHCKAAGLVVAGRAARVRQEYGQRRPEGRRVQLPDARRPIDPRFERVHRRRQVRDPEHVPPARPRRQSALYRRGEEIR
jgi:hypothetical protein